jgi:signal transduction histidine kinase
MSAAVRLHSALDRITHEMRTPLSSILGALELLEDGVRAA